MIPNQMATFIDPVQYTLRAGELTVLTPCVAFVLCLDWTDDAGIQDFHDRSLEALGDLLTHYRAEQMKNRASVNERARNLLSSWLRHPTAGKLYYLEFNGCGDSNGITPAGLSLHLNRRPLANSTPEHQQAWRARFRKVYETQGIRYILPATILRTCFPLDHPLAEPEALAAWIKGLALVKSGDFASGYAGYALNYYGAIVDSNIERVMNQRLAAVALRHPGFDWHNSHYIMNRLLPFNPATGDFLPLLKRVNWLNMISIRAIAHLGGVERITQQLGAETSVQVQAVGTGLAIQAGAKPQIGDKVLGDLIPPYCAVARVLHPVRMEKTPGPGNGFSDDRAQEWLEAFDAESQG